MIMEETAALKLMRHMLKIGIIIEYISGNYGSTIRVHLKWIWKEYECSEPNLIYTIYPLVSKKFVYGRILL